MKLSNKIACLLFAATAVVAASCENDNINPYDYNKHGDNNHNQGSTEVLKIPNAESPVG